MPIDALWILGWSLVLLIAFIYVLYRKYSGLCSVEWQEIKTAYQDELTQLDSDYYKRRDSLEIRYRNKFKALEKRHHCATQRKLHNILLVFLAANFIILNLNISEVLQAMTTFEWRIKPIAQMSSSPATSSSSPTSITPSPETAASEESPPTDSTTPYRLTVMTNPADSQVWILNIRPKYTPGMLLKSGTYTVKVAKLGYKTRVMAVEIKNADLLVYIALEKAAEN